MSHFYNVSKIFIAKVNEKIGCYIFTKKITAFFKLEVFLIFLLNNFRNKYFKQRKKMLEAAVSLTFITPICHASGKHLASHKLFKMFHEDELMRTTYS